MPDDWTEERQLRMELDRETRRLAAMVMLREKPANMEPVKRRIERLNQLLDEGESHERGRDDDHLGRQTV